jgi:hypothetical protein
MRGLSSHENVFIKKSLVRSQKTKKEILYSLCCFKYVLILGATPTAVLGRSCVQLRKLVHVRLDFMRVFAIMLQHFLRYNPINRLRYQFQTC